MTLQDAQALTSPFVRCRDGRIGTISRIRAGYALTDASQDAVGVQVRGEPALRWIPIQHLRRGRDGVCQSQRRGPIAPREPLRRETLGRRRESGYVREPKPPPTWRWTSLQGKGQLVWAAPDCSRLGVFYACCFPFGVGLHCCLVRGVERRVCAT